MTRREKFLPNIKVRETPPSGGADSRGTCPERLTGLAPNDYNFLRPTNWTCLERLIAVLRVDLVTRLKYNKCVRQSHICRQFDSSECPEYKWTPNWPLCVTHFVVLRLIFNKTKTLWTKPIGAQKIPLSAIYAPVPIPKMITGNLKLKYSGRVGTRNRHQS